jgi:O-antigen/teichoic acid export membrane protein
MSKQNLAKNTFFFTSALATQKALSFVYFIFVARAIGVDSLGKFSFALGFSAVFAMLLDFGLAQMLIRSSARKKEESQKYLSNVLFLKFFGAFVVYGLVILTINLMGYPELTKKLVYITGVIMVLDSFTLSFYSVLRGMQNLAYESIGVVVNQFIVLVAGLLVIKFDLGLIILISVYLLGSLFNFIYSSTILKIKYGITSKLIFEKEVVKSMLKIALPFAIAGLFIRIYSYMDIILLSKLTDDTSVGIYSVAYKAAFALQFIGVAFSAAMYPAFCKYFVSSHKLLAKSFEKSIHYLMIIALPLSIGVITIADKVIGPVFGYEYNDSVLPLQVLMVSLILVFLAFPVGAMLNAGNRQTRNTIHLGIVAVFNIIANLILIPLYGYVGSAIAALLSYVLLFSLGMFVIETIIKYNKKYLLLSFFKILLSSLVMGFLILIVKDYINFIITIIFGATSYLIVLYLVGGVHKDDIFQLKDLILKK